MLVSQSFLSNKVARLLLTSCACLVVLAACGERVEREYPSKPIRMIVAFSAGGSTDTLARTFAKYAEPHLGQRIVVLNKPGASGELGWSHLAKAKPDGYTIGLLNSPGVETYSFVRAKSISYNFFEDIRPLVNIVTDPGVLAISSKNDITSLDQFTDFVRANPKSVAVTHEGLGGDDHLSALAYEKNAGVALNFVAYNGNSEGIAALLGGHAMALSGNASEVAHYAKDGSVRVLATWAEQRSSYLPEVPTGKELGYEVYSAASRGIGVPRGVSDERYNKLLEVARLVINSEGFQADLARLNLPLDPVYSQDYETRMLNHYTRLKKIWDIDPWIPPQK